VSSSPAQIRFWLVVIAGTVAGYALIQWSLNALSVFDQLSQK
jgi:hypothetical protein